LTTHLGGEIIAYGSIAQTQPTSLNGVRVKVPTNSRLVIDVDTVVKDSAAAILHTLPVAPGKTQKGRTKAETYTLAQLAGQSPAGSRSFQVVMPVTLLKVAPNEISHVHVRQRLHLGYF
jgi:hypothetical protein